MRQLKMMRVQSPVKQRSLPFGYRFDFYQGTDQEAEDWVAICQHGLLSPNDGRPAFVETILNYPDLNPMKDLFFVIDPSGRRVATSAAVCHENRQGYLHMVGSLPECRGKGIGHAMLSFALEQMAERGCTHVILTTDDFRLPAIKTYLDAGFRPVIYDDPESNMRERWHTVIAALGYEPVTYITEV